VTQQVNFFVSYRLQSIYVNDNRNSLILNHLVLDIAAVVGPASLGFDAALSLGIELGGDKRL
jgi:hypothetical protein